MVGRQCSVKIIESRLSFFLFYFLIFILFSIYFHLFYFQNSGVRVGSDQSHQSHLMMWLQHRLWNLREESKRFWNKITLYNIDTTCWPHALHIVIQGRVHRPSVKVYKGRLFCKEFSIEFSCIYSNIRVCFFIQL